MPTPKYGDPHGLAERLDEWAERLSKDKRFPWPGSGIIADLKAAAIAIQPKKKSTPVEYDL